MKSIPEHELKAEDVHRMMLETLQSHLSLRTEGWRCTTEQTLNMLVKAVAEGSSLEAVCTDAAMLVDGNTLREQLNEALDVRQLRQQEAEMKAPCAPAFRWGCRAVGWKSLSTRRTNRSMEKHPSC